LLRTHWQLTLLQRQPYPYNSPFLFVIPSAARNLQFHFTPSECPGLFLPRIRLIGHDFFADVLENGQRALNPYFPA
jgi:hypothetical protein